MKQMEGSTQPTPPQPELAPIDIVREDTPWSEIYLADGSKIRARLVILGIQRAVGQYNPDGTPAYMLQHQMVLHTISPDTLKKK